MRTLCGPLLLLMSGCPEPQEAMLDVGDGFALLYEASGSPCATGAATMPLLLTAEGWFQIAPEHSDRDLPLLAWGGQFAIWLGSDGRLHASSGDDGSAGISTPLTIDDGDWHHVAVTWDTFDAEMYIDGLRLASGIMERPGGTPTTALSVGCWPGVGSMEGMLDEVRISSSIVYTSDFTPQLPLTTDDDTLGLWHFDEVPSDVATDTLGSIDLSLRGVSWLAVEGPADQGVTSQ
ncbi:MAG: hypothetical protein ACI8S6_003393 [Myxococcota bacterium]|jgi:hypothetical protein